MRSGIVTPAEKLGKVPNLVDLRAFDFARDEDFEPFRVLGVHHDTDGFRCPHLLVVLVVVTNENGLVIREAEIDTREGLIPARLMARTEFSGARCTNM